MLYVLTVVKQANRFPFKGVALWMTYVFVSGGVAGRGGRGMGDGGRVMWCFPA